MFNYFCKKAPSLMFDWVLNIRPCIIWQKRFLEGCVYKAGTLNKKSEKKSST